MVTLSGASRVQAPAVVCAVVVALVGLVACSDSALGAQEQPAAVAGLQGATADARWSPWLGCWTPDDGVPVDGAKPAPAVLVCVSPAEGRSGALIRTLVDDQVIFEGGIAPDGQQHPPREVGCQGWQLEEWASSGRRIYTSGESTCAGGRFVRISGITTITPDDRWVDVQAVTVNGRTGMRVRSYRRFLGPRPAMLADQVSPPRPRVGPMTFEELQEASARLVPVVVEAAVGETRVEFTANARSLVALADAGVSQRVIDLIIALDYPDRFVIMRPRPGRPWTRAGLMVEKIEPVAVGTYTPFAYFYGDGDEFWDSQGFIDLEPDPPVDGGGGVGTDVSRGQLVKGLGYTRVEPRPSEAAGSQPGSSTSSTSGSSEGSGTATSQGYSSGASSEGGRTAQPRPPQ